MINLRCFIVSASRFLFVGEKPKVSLAAIETDVTLPFLESLAPTNSFVSRCVVTRLSLVSRILWLRALTEIMSLVIERISVFVISLFYCRTTKNLSVHSYTWPSHCVETLSMFGPSRIPVPLCEPHKISGVHDCVFILRQRNQTVGCIERLLNLVPFHGAFHWSSLKGLLNFSRYFIIGGLYA